MKIKQWMEQRGLSYSDLLKIGFSMGFLLVFVIVMLIGAIGALIS
jgi:hypothetical protein